MNRNVISADFGRTEYLNNKRVTENLFERIISGKTVENPEVQQSVEDREYDEYLSNWMAANNLTSKDFIDKIAEIQERLFVENRKPISTKTAYNEFLKEGFNGKLWDSKEEWLKLREIEAER